VRAAQAKWSTEVGEDGGAEAGHGGEEPPVSGLGGELLEGLDESVLVLGNQGPEDEAGAAGERDGAGASGDEGSLDLVRGQIDDPGNMGKADIHEMVS
jgi:hypothetical protein